MENKWNWSHSDTHTAHHKLKEQEYITYRIARYHPMILETIYGKPWAIYREPSEKCSVNDGWIGKWRDKVGIICGSGMACAMGLPKFALFDDEKLDECKEICERDFQNLQNGEDIVLIEDEEFRKENLRKQ